MARRKRRDCGVFHCRYEAPEGRSICERHDAKQREEEKRHWDAVDVLHGNGLLPPRTAELDPLLDELCRLRTRWHRACTVVNYKFADPLLPRDEAPYAVEWCIALAAELLDAIAAVQRGENPSSTLGFTREWVYERFENVERGLMSNGLPRRKEEPPEVVVSYGRKPRTKSRYARFHRV